MRLHIVPALLLGACLAAGPAFAKEDELPAVSHDGLELRQGKMADVVYVRPGVDFSGYRHVSILECPVAFSKDWQRHRKSGPGRVSQADMDRIRKELSAEFQAIFTEELQAKGGYQVVTTGGDDVLVLRPAIVDLEVTAPDTRTAGRSVTLGESAGGMTLYLELYDGATGQILARAIDRQTDWGTGRIEWRNAVTNKADADRILRRWAKALRDRLDAVRAGAAPPAAAGGG